MIKSIYHKEAFYHGKLADEQSAATWLKTWRMAY